MESWRKLSPAVGGSSGRNSNYQPGDLLPADVARLSEMMAQHSGVVLGADKLYLVQARLATVTRQLGFRSARELCAAVVSGTDEQARAKVLDSLLTKETSFFRHPEAFEVLEKHVYPELAQRPERKLRPIRIWSAACSTGQEPYSLAIHLKETGAIEPSDVEIFATDISEAALSFAGAGEYSQLEISRGLPMTTVLKFFHQVGTHWCLADDIRKTINFRQINLLEQVYLPRGFDIIFCRNVSIYFSDESKELLFEHLLASLAPEGYLFLGASESARRYRAPLQREQIGKVIVYRPEEE
jgi:chemotaxis protein methyltransferase CheR